MSINNWNVEAYASNQPKKKSKTQPAVFSIQGIHKRRTQVVEFGAATSAVLPELLHSTYIQYS